jgi:hypothetical protein
MPRSLPAVFLTMFLTIGCAPSKERVQDPSGGSTGSTGGKTSETGGRSGAGGTTGTGGTRATGGTSGEGGAEGGVTGGGGAGSGGSNSGGASGMGGTGQDAAADAARSTDGNSARGGSSGAGGRGGSSGQGGGSGGVTGTGGTSAGTGGTMISTAPTACSFPSSWNPGSATYTTYTLPNDITACGYNGNKGANTIKNIVSSGNFAAIPGQSSSNFDTSNRCGACVQIGNAIVTIVDECPYDGNNNPPCKANPSGHLDLSYGAASAGGVKGDPNVRGQNQWKFIPCPVTGNVMVRLKPGNNNEIFIENEILPIKAVTCAGLTGSRTSYGAWHFSSNIPGATCDVTDISDRTITITAGSTQGQDVDTGRQFPKCL